MFVAPLFFLSLFLTQVEVPSAEAIAKAVRDLAADDFKDREKATEFLWRSGPAAVPALEKAATSDDFEMKFRAQGILDKVRYGITPETPAEVAKMLETFRKGDISVKQSILIKLKDKGETKTILQLLRVEKDPVFQRIASDLFRNELDRMLPGVIAKRDYDQVEQLLTQSALQDSTMQRLAAFWVIRGKAEEQAVKLRESLENREDLVARRQLVWLFRAKGDLPEAVVAAEKLADKDLSIALAMESRDWKTAARLEQEMLGPFDPPLPELARLLTWQRLSGNRAQTDKLAATLQKRATENIGDVWISAKGLLLSERANEGIDALRKDIPDIAFRLLAYRSDFEGALKLAAAEPGTVFNRDWYNKLPSQEKTTINIHRFTYAADIMRQLHWLGRKEDAAILRKLLLEIADDPDNRNLNGRVTLASMELRAGMEDEAIEDAANALSQPGGRSIMAKFFPKHSIHAISWWEFLRKEHPKQTPRETFTTLQQLLRTNPRQPPLKGWEELLVKVDASMAAADPEVRGASLLMLAETCELHSDMVTALQYAKDAAERLPAAGFVYARLLSADKQHDAAATLYLKIWELDISQALPLHLCGKSLIAAGKIEEGKQKLEMASMLCLDAATRRNLAFALHERGFSEDALPHYELALRTGPPESWAASNAAENIGNLISKTDPLRAADLWERLQLYLLTPSANPSEFEPLLDIGRLVHKTRARGLLEAGKKDEALAEMKLCEQISPGNIDLAEDMVPLLKAKGFATEADALYQRAYAVHAPLAEKFPDSPPLRNNIAWLCAVSHQRLDEALTHAQKAVELSPNAPSYLDTLAEVHFHKGDRSKAVEYGKKVLELAPSNKLFAERLKHFENDPLPQ